MTSAGDRGVGAALGVGEAVFVLLDGADVVANYLGLSLAWALG